MEGGKKEREKRRRGERGQYSRNPRRLPVPCCSNAAASSSLHSLLHLHCSSMLLRRMLRSIALPSVSCYCCCCVRCSDRSALSLALLDFSPRSTFKKRAPRALQAIRDFARKTMGTEDVRIDTLLNKFLWKQV